MSDDRKRDLIRFLNRLDSISAKGSRAKGWNAKTVTLDETVWRREAENELSRMRGKELDRELGRQILYTLPVTLFLISVIAAAVWILFI